MPHLFDDAVLTAVLGHMNGDHADDNLLIARAFADGVDGDAIVSASMTGFDGDGGRWTAILADADTDSDTDTGAGTRTVTVEVPWPGGPISERPAVRREIVALYDEACRRLGVEPRPHA
ncbi:DUF2470 domain-containing protein [Microbacterium sp. HD4P20]|uniref:DUF2470 domain-containing protein n=1 Tax=Microbacterium sp. HD4P20 TaxID=2864874 RepID=UPI001C63FBED|nr:DUF2470 domain-containing protein [Microbacterium sp. HD4P20]MCP2638231.1 DUF2470 domain-containing protein [Microbacterium sp. HD4P20]